MTPCEMSQTKPLELCFVGPNNLLVVQQDDFAAVVQKQPVRYIKHLTSCARTMISGTRKGLSSARFVAKEFLLGPGEHSNALMEYTCDKYWIVLSGIASITVAATSYLVAPRQGLLIAPMQEHQIVNNSDKTVRFVEVAANDLLKGNEAIRFIDSPIYR